MTHPLQRLLENNRAWSREEIDHDPAYFTKLIGQQAPEYLWIGCSDSRVPANQITGLAPGEVFVHRNVANLVVHTDLNCLSVIDFAVDVLRVKHIMVVGHYGCGGVHAALNRSATGLAQNWLRHVEDVERSHEALVSATPAERRVNLMCELNVLEQTTNVCQSTIVQSAWRREAALTVHGWVYSLSDGLLVDLDFCADAAAAVAGARERSLAAIRGRYSISAMV